MDRLTEKYPGLAGTDSRQRARVFEELVLASWGMSFSHSETLLGPLTEAYRELSCGLLEHAKTPHGATPSTVSAIAWGLVYGARTFHIAHRILAQYPVSRGELVELGSGQGPFALAAALRSGGSSVLVDQSEVRLLEGRRIFSEAGLPPPSIVRQDATRYAQPSAAIAVPASLNEMMKGRNLNQGAKIIQRWVQALRPGGRLYIVEPGTRPIARQLQSLRDLLKDSCRIVAPCATEGGCPILQNPNDWCHFTWRQALGPLGQRILMRAGRDAKNLHASWLVLENGPPQVSTNHRVLELRDRGKNGIQARLCSREGLVTVQALKRHRTVHTKFKELEAGTMVRITPRPEGTRMFRVEHPEQIVKLEP